MTGAEIVLVAVCAALVIAIIVILWLVNTVTDMKDWIVDIEYKAVSNKQKIAETLNYINDEIMKLERRTDEKLMKKENKWNASAEYDEDWDES